MNEYKKRYCNNKIENSNNFDAFNEINKSSFEKELNQMRNCCSNSLNKMNDNCKNDCECGFDIEDSVFPSEYSFGQSYVPIQRMNKIFNPEIGLKMGTIFPELVSSYSPNQSICEIEKIKNLNNIGEGCNR